MTFKRNILMLTFAYRRILLVLGFLIITQTVACQAENTKIGSISSSNLITQIKAKKSLLILDVRTKKEYDLGHIPGAINIDFKELNQRIDEIEDYKNSTIVVYCERGIRVNVAEVILSHAGFKSILNLEGDMSAWRSNNLPIEVN